MLRYPARPSRGSLSATAWTARKAGGVKGRSLAVFWAALLACGGAFADAPFGFQTNENPAAYGYCKASGLAELYTCSTAPIPHSAFDLYLLYYVDGSGLCKISALGKRINNDNYGSMSRKEADEIALEVARKYGPQTNKHDFVLPNSIWEESRDWMMGVNVKERYYGYDWEEDEGYKRVGDVEAIRVFVRAISSDSGRVVATFKLNSILRCAK